MSQRWDEFSKSLAEPLPRRESLWRIGVALAGALLGPLGLHSASAGRRQQDPCKSFCRCRRKSDQNQCLAACRACADVGGRLCGSCGGFGCCAAGDACCGDYCADLDNDLYNCGDCGYVCEDPGSIDVGVACVSGLCEYFVCGPWTDYNWDSNNCGRCGNVCPWGTACAFGVCGSSGGGDSGF